MRKAVDLDPLNATWRGIWSAHLTNAGLHERAIEEGRRAVELEENYFAPPMILGEAYLGAGRIDDAIASLEDAHRLGPWDAMATGLLAAAHALNGNRARAEALIEEMGDAPNRSGAEWSSSGIPLLSFRRMLRLHSRCTATRAGRRSPG